MRCFVIGGSKGIGDGIAKSLCETHTVFVISRHKSDDFLESHSLKYLYADLVNIDQIHGTITQLIRDEPTCIVFSQRYRGDSLYEEIELMMQSPILLIQRLKPNLLPGSKIVFIGSVAGDHVVHNQSAAYHATRAGIEGLTRYYAVTLASSGIQVFCVRPGTTLKPYNAGYFNDNPGVINHIIDRSPMSSLPSSNEVGNVVNNLITYNWPSVTGATIDVDTGTCLVYHGS